MDKAWTALTLATLVGLAALMSGFSPQEKAPEAKAGTSVKGKIRFEGKVPKERAISTEGDPYCSGKNTEGLKTDIYRVAADGAVGNVFVYVKKGLEGKTFDVPKEAVVLTQANCTYSPHVFGIMVGQTLTIRNGDDTLHNIHSQSKLNPEFNFGQATKGQETAKTFTTPEVMIKIKCDVHGWMSTFVGVLPHPFYQVTGDKGEFELKGLPPGEYEVEAWHEKFGTQSQTVKVGDGEAKEANFTFKGK